MIVSKAFAVIKKDFLTSIRYRNGFLLNVISPAAQLATFYYLSRAIGPQFRPDGMPYLVFLIVGMGFYTFLISGIHSFVQTIHDAQRTGTLEVLMSTATSAPALVLLSSVSAFAGNLVQLVLYVTGGLIIFAPASRINVAAALAVIVLSLLISVAIGLCAAALQISIQKGSAVLWVMGSCSWLVAGTMFPVTTLPAPLRVFSAILPFTHSLAGMRLALIQSIASPALINEIWTLALSSAVLLPVSIAFFSWTVRRARHCGTLSFY